MLKVCIFLKANSSKQLNILLLEIESAFMKNKLYI